jgi:hypothetical protein
MNQTIIRFRILLLLLPLFLHTPALSAEIPPAELAILRAAYPTFSFSADFDSHAGDWRILIEGDDRSSVLYYAGGRFLKREHLPNQENYRRLIYPFPNRVADPASMPPEQIERFTRFGSTENRSSSPVTSADFFDAIHKIDTRAAVESSIVAATFLGLTLRIHQNIISPLGRVEESIRETAKEDPEAAEFISSLGSASGYHWRPIQDTGGRSFHSMGLAIDLLPKELQGKRVYWLWEKNGGNDQWMLTPLEQRWMPPERVMEAFEREGFIWGGKWAVWDNMHFEYRPELLRARDGM